MIGHVVSREGNLIPTDKYVAPQQDCHWEDKITPKCFACDIRTAAIMQPSQPPQWTDVNSLGDNLTWQARLDPIKPSNGRCEIYEPSSPTSPMSSTEGRNFNWERHGQGANDLSNPAQKSNPLYAGNEKGELEAKSRIVSHLRERAAGAVNSLTMSELETTEALESLNPLQYSNVPGASEIPDHGRKDLEATHAEIMLLCGEYSTSLNRLADSIKTFRTKCKLLLE